MEAQVQRSYMYMQYTLHGQRLCARWRSKNEAVIQHLNGNVNQSTSYVIHIEDLPVCMYTPTLTGMQSLFGEFEGGSDYTVFTKTLIEQVLCASNSLNKP